MSRTRLRTPRQRQFGDTNLTAAQCIFGVVALLQLVVVIAWGLAAVYADTMRTSIKPPKFCPGNRHIRVRVACMHACMYLPILPYLNVCFSYLATQTVTQTVTHWFR
jgi:hypothetical protein